MENLRESEKLVQCPYNPSHHIRQSRMDVHLTKCRRSYRESEEIVICDFNTSHRISKLELQYHHENCPSRKSTELSVFMEAEKIPIPIKAPLVPVPVDQTWDLAPPVKSYDPQKYCEENKILRRIDTESAAKRRDFRESERLRFSNLPQEEPSQDRKPSDKKPKENMHHLPPVPKFANNLERAPADIMIRPPKVVIPKRKN
ncbi:unnamed protein product [Ceutorhynchus assimilis]|uniref:CHHC U11-48K-type domain-containing protein n=1 Tax=Ceutorhynchus assimilis TaxID=467358 RepID=A0A9N9MY47_9CUCU|nr:unnamed protein product [Ceutorhynchus assimilis]